MSKGIDRRTRRQRCIVLHPEIGEAASDVRTRESRLEEAVGLAAAIDLDVVHAEAVPLKKPKPSTLVGQGALDRVTEVMEASEDADEDKPIVIVDAMLSPVQQRNLERAWHTKVLDRTALILEIFGARARTREGRLQVDLAQLTYQLGRLVRSWTHLERQRGGVGFMGGPGETQIETDRRLIRQRIDRLKKDLADVSRTRELHRSARRRVPHPVVALVGYTNAGKSTLFNRLTEAKVTAKDQLFATLDPTMRALDLPSGRRAILSDTVGFVSNLPHELVTAFHATLEEVVEADVIVHVRDVANPDTEAQKSDVLKVLGDLHVRPSSGEAVVEEDSREKPVIEALNKIDMLDEETKQFIANRSRIGNILAIPISAHSGENCDVLLESIEDILRRGDITASVELSYEDGAALAWLFERGEVLSRNDHESGIHLDVRLSPAVAARFQQTFDIALDN